MALSYPDSTPIANTFQPKLTQQDVLHQTQAELLALIRVSPDEAIENWQKTPVWLGDWSSRLESEINYFLW